MLRKKQYKQEQQYSQYHSLLVPRPNGRRVTVYFKRYQPPQMTPESLYQLINSRGKPPSIPSEYPIDRTLEMLSFDGDLEFMRGVSRKLGRVRKFISGESKYQGKQVHFCIVVFKFQYDLVKCFVDEYLQNIVNQLAQGIRVSEEEHQQQRRELIAEHIGEELEEAEKLAKLHEEGFNPITNKFGQFKVDKQANLKMVQELPQTKRKKKQLEKRQKERQAQEVSGQEE